MANDSTMNYLLLNEGGRFVRSALTRGAGYNGAGQAEAGMGVAIAATPTPTASRTSS